MIHFVVTWISDLLNCYNLVLDLSLVLVLVLVLDLVLVLVCAGVGSGFGVGATYLVKYLLDADIYLVEPL